MKKKIALIAGGDSGEYPISIKSATMVSAEIDRSKYDVYLIKIKADELNTAQYANKASSLQCKIAGVKIVQAFGTPGSGASIRLRGSTSITGNQSPLILVDGNILESSLADINVDDIESMDILDEGLQLGVVRRDVAHHVELLAQRVGLKVRCADDTGEETSVFYDARTKTLQIDICT